MHRLPWRTPQAAQPDKSTTVDVLANDTDADDGHTLTLASVSTPAGNGSVSIVDNKLVFNPGEDFSGLAGGATQHVTLTYTTHDDANATSTGTVDFTVTGANHAPTAVADNTAGTQNQVLTVDVLTNDTDPDAEHTLTLASASAPDHKGSVSIVDNKAVFTPGSDFAHLAQGTVEHVTLNYTIHDEFGATSSSTVDVAVTGTNDAPVAVADTAGGAADKSTTVDVLANDTDADDGHTLTLASVSAPDGKGTVSIVDNKLVFNPGTDFANLARGATEHVTLTYTSHDDANAGSTGTVDFTVTGGNHAPVAVADNAAGTQNQVLTVDVLTNDTDADADHVLTLASASAPDHKGAVSIVDNKLVFNPGSDFAHLAQGTVEHVTLNYALHDEFGATASSTVDCHRDWHQRCTSCRGRYRARNTKSGQDH